MDPAADAVGDAAAAANPIEVDARGLRCPLPVIRLAEAARQSPAGTRIVVLATDPAARHDIPAWCRMRDHELVEMISVGETTEAGPAGEATATSETEAVAAQDAHPTYQRFVVKLLPDPSQRSKAGGTGSESERSSRAM